MQGELKEEVQKAMFLLLMADKSMDTSVSEQLIPYLGYVDIASEDIVTRFASIRKIERQLGCGSQSFTLTFLLLECRY